MARIYIVDDDADIRNVLTFSLTEAGHEVSVARDGPSLLAAALADLPDLLILDVMMPKMTGFEVIDRLVAEGVRDRLRVMLLTAKSSEKDRLLGLEMGADLYLTKPFDPDEVARLATELAAATPEELASWKERERDEATLLFRLESILGD